MTINALFFGATADIARVREMKIDVSAGESVKGLLAQLSGEFPTLADHKLLIAVNEEYAEGNTQLKDGDEVAIFTAVSGG